MFRYLPIRKVHARQVLDSRGNPTVEVEVTVGEGVVGINGYTGRAMVPSGASTGKFEAVELRDGDKEKYIGLGVEKAVNNVNTKLADVILGENALDQAYIDSLLIETDGTENKSSVGANATLGVSMAVARAAAKALRIPLYQYLGGCHTSRMPVPMMNILNGGKHADNTVDLQEFMIMPVGAKCFAHGIRMCAEIYQFLKILLKEKKLSTGVGDEGGFAPDLADSRDVLALIVEAVERAGYKPGEEIGIAIDAAASELYDEKKGVYYFPGESRMKGEEILRDGKEMVDYYEKLIEEFPIVSIEDGLQEDDVIVVFKHFGIELLHEDIPIVPRRLTVAYGVPGDLQTDAVGRRQLQKLAVHVRGPDETVAQHQDPVRLALVQNFKIKGDGPARGRIRGSSRV